VNFHQTQTWYPDLLDQDAGQYAQELNQIQKSDEQQNIKSRYYIWKLYVHAVNPEQPVHKVNINDVVHFRMKLYWFSVEVNRDPFCYLVHVLSVMVIVIDVLKMYYGPFNRKSINIIQYVNWVLQVLWVRSVMGELCTVDKNLLREDTPFRSIIRIRSELNSDTLVELAMFDLPPSGEICESQDLIVSGSLDVAVLNNLFIIQLETIIFFILVVWKCMLTQKINYPSIESISIGEHTEKIGSEQLICVDHTNKVIVLQNHKGDSDLCTWSCVNKVVILYQGFELVLVSTGVVCDHPCKEKLSAQVFSSSRTCTTNRPHKDTSMNLIYLWMMSYCWNGHEIVVWCGRGVQCERDSHMKSNFMGTLDLTVRAPKMTEKNGKLSG
jgi:hypothetical protein